MTANSYDEAANAISRMAVTSLGAARETRDAIEETVGLAYDDSDKGLAAIAAYEDGMARAERVYRVLSDAVDAMTEAASREISGMPGVTPMGTGHAAL